jgi:hypothetical protein
MDYSEVIHYSQEFPRNLDVGYSTLMHAEPLRVYQTLTTSEGLDALFTSGASVTAHPGESLALQWHPNLPDYATAVEINRAAVEGGTIVSR